MSVVRGFRIPGAKNEQTLAGRPTEEVVPPSHSQRPYVVEDLSKAPHFVADCFFITQRLFHTALIPAGRCPLLFLLIIFQAALLPADHHLMSPVMLVDGVACTSHPRFSTGLWHLLVGWFVLPSKFCSPRVPAGGSDCCFPLSFTFPSYTLVD